MSDMPGAIDDTVVSNNVAFVFYFYFSYLNNPHSQQLGACTNSLGALIPL